ncbi:MAG: regulatory protein RecX [Anditalea sp.]
MSFLRKEYPEEASGKSFTPAEAKVKIAAYCAYQERCQKEVRNKLFEYGLSSNEVEKLLTTMILEGFLNEERFAKAFARGKFRLKRWGKIKIRKELKFRMLNDTCINLGMKEIDEQEYWETLLYLAEKKWSRTVKKDLFIRKIKLKQFLTFRGYESDLIQSALDKLTEGP